VYLHLERSAFYCLGPNLHVGHTVFHTMHLGILGLSFSQGILVAFYWTCVVSSLSVFVCNIVSDWMLIQIPRSVRFKSFQKYTQFPKDQTSQTPAAASDIRDAFQRSKDSRSATITDQCLMLQTGNRDGEDQHKPRTLHILRVQFELPESLITIAQLMIPQ